MKIVSWNVNGIRAISWKGFTQWLTSLHADVVCVQETKASQDQLDEKITTIPGYTSYFESAEKKGYSGVGVYTKSEPENVTTLGVHEFDSEGRTLVVEYPQLIVINAYFPNSGDGAKRLGYKLDFCKAMLEYCLRLSSEKKPFVLCGDYNIAHKPIDLARPEDNEGSAGYLPEERAWMDTFISSGFIDTFRMFNNDFRNAMVVQSPSHVSISCPCYVGPPGVVPRIVIEHAKSIDKPA
jgi:exodeoxyribonuclease-3